MIEALAECLPVLIIKDFRNKLVNKAHRTHLDRTGAIGFRQDQVGQYLHDAPLGAAEKPVSPFLAAAEVSGSYRNIGDGSGADQANYQFYLASRKLASEHPDIVRIILDEIARTDGEAAKTPSGTAQLVSTATGIPLDAISLALGRMGYGVGPLSPQIIDDQQKLADLYLREKIIDRKIAVQQAISNAGQ